MEGSPEGRYLPEPFFTIHLIVAAFMVALQCLNTAYAVHICRRQRSSFTTVLAIQQALLVVFCICKLARSWAGPLGDNESQTARILYLVGDTFYTLSAFLYLLLLIRRFSLGNSAGLWYRPSWDPIMITAAIVLFCFAFISGVYRGIQRLDTTAFPGYEKGIRYNIVCYCVFTLFILAMDTVLSFLMYKRICILKSQLE
ncbi:hypothetical protein BC832DRAFT_205391 [Gaertneriomyces semiglobifer]|nr:hypothetical protein BC832DRAFT_205391 [Gaertneriomyces semiglobifer]